MGNTCAACFDKTNEVPAGSPRSYQKAGEEAKEAQKDPEPPAVYTAEAEEEEELRGGKFTLVLHSAKINRSFAKIGHMDPYAIIDVDGKEVGRSKPDKSAHKTPHWESSFSWESEGVPKEIHIAVWDKNDFHRDVFIGATTIPCSSDMGRHDDLAFTITKRSEATGTIIVGIAFEHARRSQVKRTPTALGLEFDHIQRHLDLEKKDAVHVQLEETEAHQKKAADHAHNDEDQPRLTRKVSKLTQEETKSGLQPIMGCWTCVETHGLDAFLKATGVGMFQRKIANAAKWPSWEYNLKGQEVFFINHSAIGDLTETFPLDQEYDWKDGHGNPMKCTATWVPSSDGGTLFTERKGGIGNYKEERKVIGNRLEFKLIHGSGVEWGRAFEKNI